MVNTQLPFKRRTHRIRIFRVFVFCCLLGLLHVHHQRTQRDASAQASWEHLLSDINRILPSVTSCQPNSPVAMDSKETTEATNATASAALINADGKRIGTALMTSPSGDHLIGFSGPTNVLLVFDDANLLQGCVILSSKDTQEHVSRVADDPSFFRQLIGQAPQQLAKMNNVDSVTGATLTSLSILEAIRLRSRLELGQPPTAVTSLRFPDPPRLEDAKKLYPDATTLEVMPDSAHAWTVKDSEGRMIGHCLRLSPAADNQIGYQGPTDALVAFDDSDMVTGIALGVSFDNEPYVGYVRDDRSFRRLWKSRQLQEIAAGDASRVEGVSGATMTSQSVAQAVHIAAQALLDERKSLALRQSFSEDQPQRSVVMRISDAALQYRTLSTGAIILFGVILGTTHLRSRRWLRRLYQCVVIVWLGWINADFVSQAQLAGWTLHGIPWDRAMGQLILTIATFAVPLFRGTNVYCSHVCPHGALQQVVRNRIPWQLKLSARASRVLKMLPVGLLLLVLAGAFGLISLRPVDLEPFDAWAWGIAGTATVTIAVVGLTFSLIVPMGYCRFGCPTGSLLDWLSTRSDRWSAADTFSVILLCVSLALVVL